MAINDVNNFFSKEELYKFNKHAEELKNEIKKPSYLEKFWVA